MAPKIIDKWLHVAQDGYGAVERRYRGRGGMTPKIIVVHIQEGSNRGSWQHFHQVLASSTVLIGKNGDIWRLVPESDGPWTNGDVKSPTAKGREILNKYGWDPNYYSLTIETEGFSTEYPKPQAQVDSVVWQIQQWMKTYDIPLENVIRHADINQVTRPGCPGDAFFNEIMKRLKVGGAKDIPVAPVSQYVEAQPVMDGDKPWDGSKDIEIGNVHFHADKKKVTVGVDSLVVRQWASTASGKVRDSLKKGETFEVLGWVKGEKVDNEDRWWVTKYGSRMWVGGTVEKPSTKKKDVVEDKPDHDTLGRARIVNGHIFYPLGADGEGREFTVIANANLRKYASTEQAPVGTVEKGKKVLARYYTDGERVDGEDMWLVLNPADGKGDPIAAGPRLSVTVVAERPY